MICSSILGCLDHQSRVVNIGLFFLYLNIICHNKIILVNCAVEENNPTQTVLDISANTNYDSKKKVNGMKMTYEKDDSNSKVNRSYFTLKKVNLCIPLMMTRSIKTYTVNS